ncbi:hypothetical protein C8J55DRAFT_606566 [Lentinula edodes]|uniref:Uncharacterized protein n=1 Tax=Lentinula lateritia TaxID=40482 RepID=A0A9W9DNV9_9AGAR|nr:hypothetical protein C8J55DRAFT_606566 [Lentinula edodes]
MDNNLPKKPDHVLGTFHLITEVDAEVVPKPKPIQKSRPKAPAYEMHGPLILGLVMSRSATVHFASSLERDAPVTPKRKPIRRPRAKAPAYETHGPLVLGFAFTIEELQKRALERLPEYQELSQQSLLPLMKMIPKAQRLIYDLCDDIAHLWPQAFKGWGMDPNTRGGLHIVGLSHNRDADRLSMPTREQAEEMRKILGCGEAHWYSDLVPPSKFNYRTSRF